MRYGFGVKVPGTFDEVIRRATEALATEGFGVLTTIDVKATLKKKLDKELRPYTILGACNPALASQAIDEEPGIGLLLPCNVLVREEEDGLIQVAFMDPEAVLDLVGNPQVSKLAAEVRARLQRVAERLAAG